jgi:hypothetical protein
MRAIFGEYGTKFLEPWLMIIKWVLGPRATFTFLSKLVETISYNDNRVLASSIRLGQVFNWLLDGGLSITGQAYFAVARKFPWEEVCCRPI